MRPITKARIDAKISVKAAAAHARVAVATLQGYENGNNIRPEIAKKLTELYGCNIQVACAPKEPHKKGTTRKRS